MAQIFNGFKIGLKSKKVRSIDPMSTDVPERQPRKTSCHSESHGRTKERSRRGKREWKKA